jgi:hypothetical protein
MQLLRSFAALCVCAALALSQQPAAPQKKGGGPPTPPPIQPKPEELAKIKEKSEQIQALVKELRAKRADATMIGDVEVFAHAGRMLLEYPELINTQAALDRSYPVLDRGIERAKQLQAGKPEWNQGKKQIHAYYSEDGWVGPTLRHHPSRELRPGQAGASVRLAAWPAE